jgi:site-specific DNA recombinase
MERQLVRDGFVNMIIVWDLRRFSRNFVHSAMIFEEIESAGGEVVSVSENIEGNSLEGKLIRAILSWQAESEREKIVEYANRHWQSRLAQNLPMATGRAPYGWKWKDKSKMAYTIDREEAATRLSIFTMFVEEDMSIRAIAHKLTEHGVLPPAMSRGARVKSTAWQPSTVHSFLTDPENIGILRICKTKKVMTAKGKEARLPNENIKVLPGGIPAIITIEQYELAQRKLKHNQVDKSHVHRNPEDFLLKSHIFCKTCGYRMGGRYRCYDGIPVAYYICNKYCNKYDACPDMPEIMASKVNEMVWTDCCRVFDSIALIHETIRTNIERDLNGKVLLAQLRAELAFAEAERDKHPQGSYYYELTSQDVMAKQEKLRKYEVDLEESSLVLKMLDTYQQNIFSFLDFLNSMRGRYQEATFKEKRNALEVLGVTVSINPVPQQSPKVTYLETEKEWLSLSEAALLAGINPNTLGERARKGEFVTYKREESRRCTYVHRDEFNVFLAVASFQPRHLRDDIQPRVEIHYSPILTGVQSCLIYTSVPTNALIAG